MLLKWPGIFLWQTHQCLRPRLSCWWWCEERQSGRGKRPMAGEKIRQANRRHYVPVAPPSPPSLRLSPPRCFCLCPRAGIRSSGFLAWSRDAPTDPHYCGFIKTFPPLSYCAWRFVLCFLFVSCVTSLTVFLCKLARLQRYNSSFLWIMPPLDTFFKQLLLNLLPRTVLLALHTGCILFLLSQHDASHVFIAENKSPGKATAASSLWWLGNNLTFFTHEHEY